MTPYLEACRSGGERMVETFFKLICSLVTSAPAIRAFFRSADRRAADPTLDLREAGARTSLALPPFWAATRKPDRYFHDAHSRRHNEPPAHIRPPRAFSQGRPIVDPPMRGLRRRNPQL